MFVVWMLKGENLMERNDVGYRLRSQNTEAGDPARGHPSSTADPVFFSIFDIFLSGITF